MAHARSNAATCRKIAELFIVTYRPHVEAVLIMWREGMNLFYGAAEDSHFHWRQDDAQVHAHLKRFLPGVTRELESPYNLTIVRVGHSIREFLGHAQRPDRGRRGQRTDERYCQAVASPGNPTMGIVCFPPGCMTDHPLIVEAQRRRMKSSVSHVDNSASSLDRARSRGTISAAQWEGIHQDAEPVCRRIADAEPPPAIPQLDAPDGPPGAEPPPSIEEERPPEEESDAGDRT
jgi:hypothetical protein